jgi:hypothetical protein
MKPYTSMEWIKQLFVGIEDETDDFNTSIYIKSDGFDKKDIGDGEKGLLELPEDILLLLIQYLTPKDLIR